MKKKYFFLVLLIVANFISVAQSRPSDIDVKHYAYSISVSDSSNLIYGKAIIDFITLKNTEQLNFDLVDLDRSGKGMIVKSVKLNGSEIQFKHEFKLLTLNKTVKTTEKRQQLEINYQGVPKDGLIISKSKFGRRTFFSDHWPNRARNWLPCIDHPSEKATIEFEITAPSKYNVVANGDLLSEKKLSNSYTQTHWREKRELPMKIIAVGIGEFAIDSSLKSSIVPVTTWVYPEERTKGFHDFAVTPEIIEFYTKYFGPYPLSKMASVESKTIFGGLENAGAVFYSENLITGKRSFEATIAHEVVHQWFGDMATETDWQHLWLSEGFATYFSAFYMYKKYGVDTLNRILIQDRNKVIQFSKQKKTPVVDTTVTDYLDLLNANSYQKGGWVLRMLNKQVGDSVFLNGIRSYYDQYAGGNASTDDFRKVMEKISGKKLDIFFKQWLYETGQPALQIIWKYDEKARKIAFDIEQKQSNLFEFPIDLQILGSQKKLQTFFIKERKTQISINSNEKPSQIIMDPFINLLFEGNIREAN